MRLFTKKFFDLSAVDQVQIVQAALAECDVGIAQAVDSVSRSRAKARRRRIEQKAIGFGIWDDEDGQRPC